MAMAYHVELNPEDLDLHSPLITHNLAEDLADVVAGGLAPMPV